MKRTDSQKAKNAMRARKSQYRKHARDMERSSAPWVKEIRCKTKELKDHFDDFIKMEGLSYLTTVMGGGGALSQADSDESIGSEDAVLVRKILKRNPGNWAHISDEEVRWFLDMFPDHAAKELLGENNLPGQQQSDAQGVLDMINIEARTNHRLPAHTAPDGQVPITDQLQPELLEALAKLAGPCPVGIDLFARAKEIADLVVSFGHEPFVHIFDKPPRPGDIPTHATIYDGHPPGDAPGEA